MAKDKLIRQRPFRGKTAIVCGGSRGIGKASAAEILRLGGSLCIIARKNGSLIEAAQELTSQISDPAQFVETISCDATDMEQLKPLLEDFIDRQGLPDYLLNVVGYAQPDYVQNLSLEDFQKSIDINYYGQLVPTLILLPHFMRVRKGHIAFVSSILGYMGLMGYANYTPSKYAIVGLAETMRHELKPYDIRFSILFPPDTDTPGFKQENLTKPKEWFYTSATQLWTAEDVAERFIEGIHKGKFYILVGQAGLLWRLSRFFPGLVHTYTDYEVEAARKKLARATSSPDIESK